MERSEIITEPGRMISKEQELIQNTETCLFAVCRPAAEQCAAVCRKGGGLVKPMEEMEAADREWTLGLYAQLLETVERYCGCAERKRDGSCALTGLECEGAEGT